MELLGSAIQENPPVVIRDGGVIADGYDSELDELRALNTNAGDYLLELEEREKARTGIATLKVGYNRVHGYYIEISRGQSDNAPVEYIRRQTLKNAERFITPELKTFEDKALSAKSRSLAREKYLYEELLERLNESLEPCRTVPQHLRTGCFIHTGRTRPEFKFLPARAASNSPASIFRAAATRW